MFNNFFDYKKYRLLMHDQIQNRPNQGYGELSKAAKSMGIAPSLLTSVMKEEKHFTPEQALSWSAWSQWSELESEYFLNLVQLERSGTKSLQDYFEKRLKEIREKSNLLKNRLPPQAELPEEVKAIFYSDWSYTAVRLCSSLNNISNAEDIAEKLKIPRSQVIRILEFLIRNNLVVENKDRFSLGTQSTHVGSQEPLVIRHHTNWRLKSIEKFSKDPSRGLFFTSPCALSNEDFKKIKKLIMTYLDSIYDVIDPSPSEKLACLNIDWFFINDED